MWDGWAIRRYTPDGGLDAVVHLPGPRPSGCIFGGDDVTTPYVMTGRVRLSAKHLAEAPLSDSLFAPPRRAWSTRGYFRRLSGPRTTERLTRASLVAVTLRAAVAG